MRGSSSSLLQTATLVTASLAQPLSPRTQSDAGKATDNTLTRGAVVALIVGVGECLERPSSVDEGLTLASIKSSSAPYSILLCIAAVTTHGRASQL